MDSRKTHFTFSCFKWTFSLKIISIKGDRYKNNFQVENCFDWSKKFKILRNLESVTSTIFTHSPVTVHFTVQLGSVRNHLKVLIKFFGICLKVFPSINTATALLSYSFSFSGSQYKFSSPAFGVHMSIYAWYFRTNELNENWWSFLTIMLIFSSIFLNKISEIDMFVWVS